MLLEPAIEAAHVGDRVAVRVARDHDPRRLHANRRRDEHCGQHATGNRPPHHPALLHAGLPLACRRPRSLAPSRAVGAQSVPLTCSRIVRASAGPTPFTWAISSTLAFARACEPPTAVSTRRPSTPP